MVASMLRYRRPQATNRLWCVQGGGVDAFMRQTFLLVEPRTNRASKTYTTMIIKWNTIYSVIFPTEGMNITYKI